MQIGCNYSPELMALLEEDSSLVDAIKLSWEEHYPRQRKHIDGYKPVLLHFIPRVFNDNYSDPDMIAYYKRLLVECGINHVGSHFIQDSNCHKFSGWDRDRLEKYLVERLRFIKEQLDTKLLIENMPLYAFKEGFEVMADPHFITEVCVKADVGLLLDCAHARISARPLGLSETEYLNRLPVDRIYEVHLSGPRLEDGQLLDRHDYLLEDDYEFLGRVLDLTTPKYLTLEYGGEGQAFEGKSEGDHILGQIRRIKTMVTYHDAYSRTVDR